MATEAAWYRASHHLLEYLDMRPGHALVAYEPPYEHIARRLQTVADSHKSRVELLQVDSISPDELRVRLSGAEKFLCAFNRTFAAGLSEHVTTMVECAVDFAERAYTLTDISHDFVTVFQADPAEIAARNAALIRVLQTGRQLVVSDEAGTDLVINFQDQYEWVNQDGFSEADYALIMNLPMGEVATYTPDVNGRLVFVGGLLGTIPIGRKYGPVRTPVEITIVDGRVVEVGCENRALRDDLLFCLEFDSYTGQVNEIGFGTNPAIRGPIRGFNYKHEESRVGFHLGFGASLAQQNVERLTPHHLDLLVESCRMTLDGTLLFDGDYWTDSFAASASAAPLRVTSRSCCMPSVSVCETSRV